MRLKSKKLGTKNKLKAGKRNNTNSINCNNYNTSDIGWSYYKFNI